MMTGTSRKKYKCIFFDLDHTLWDYEKNAEDTLTELYHHYSLQQAGISDPYLFYLKFKEVNLSLWDLYDRNLVDQNFIRKERFKKILTHFNAYDEQLSDTFSDHYLATCPKKNNLIPHTLDILEYLRSKYNLTVITNGFEEIQNVKMVSGNLHHFFDHVITSQKAGHKKPSEKIFQFALALNNVSESEVIMIGDNLVTDIGGARQAGIDNIFFNREKMIHDQKPDYEIGCLSELKNIL